MEVIEHVADPRRYLRDCTALLAPGGLMVVATLNRTLKALALAKIGAEYILRWLPRDTHDWRKFLTPEEMRGFLDGEAVDRRGAVRGDVQPAQRPLDTLRRRERELHHDGDAAGGRRLAARSAQRDARHVRRRAGDRIAPVAGRGLPVETQARVPGTVVAAGEPAPVGRKRQQHQRLCPMAPARWATEVSTVTTASRLRMMAAVSAKSRISGPRFNSGADPQ